MCKLCEKNPVYEFTNKRKVCKRCYIHWFEKKFLFTIRKFNLINKGEEINYYNKKDFRSVVLKRLLEIFEKKSTSKIKKISTKEKPLKKIIALPTTLDMTSKKIIQKIINQKLDTNEFLPKQKKIILPLYLFLDKEVMLYTKLKKLKFNKIKPEKQDEVAELINSLEKKHPEIKRAIVNSYLKLNN
jgi:hypothetical protein